MDEKDKVSDSQFQLLIKNRDFRKWLGDDGTELANNFMLARRKIFAKTPLPAFSNETEEFYKDIRLENYYKYQSAFDKYIRKRFDLRVVDNGNKSCD